MKTVCLWSGPRNVSTALMYSFAQRNDTRVVDEPLYGHYLRESGASHPGADEIMTAMNCDANRVLSRLFSEDENSADLLFLKSMAHHLIGIDPSAFRLTENAFLIRNPREMLPSLIAKTPNATLADTGLRQQWELFQRIRQQGRLPTVIDSRELLLNPEKVLTQFCQRIDVQFDRCMLTWPAGPIPEDGVWAKYWYHAVHRSTGFMNYTAKRDFPSHLRPLLDQCQPYYDGLYAHAIRIGQSMEAK